ncbi:MAG: tetratricopeptide repeat protein [Saprospiraceae bacterium]
MSKAISFAISLLFLLGCTEPETKISPATQDKEATLKKYLNNGAWNHHFLSKEWDEWVTRGLQEDSTIAYLWQQKALPYWKQQKFQLAISYYEKAVALDPENWLSRLAFLKCIYAKDYLGALKDLTAYRMTYGQAFEQDHTLEFYEGVCYLQLNQFDKAQAILLKNLEAQEAELGPDWVPFLDRYYLGISYFEQGEYEVAVTEFNKVLLQYPGFSDAQYHKSICLDYLGEKEKSKELMAIGKINFKNGYSFNEDSNLYVDYPYQITWQWDVAESILN